MSRLPGPRRHTFYFLDQIREIAPVFLDTEIDMSAVLAHRRTTKHSIVTYVLWSAARVLAAHPDANVALRGRRMARYDTVGGKFTFDKVMSGHRVVLSTVLPDLDRTSLAGIQRQVERFRDGNPDTMPEFAAIRRLHRIPMPLGGLLYRLAVRPLRQRPARMGTFAVTSLGHRPVDGFYSVGGATLTIGLGRSVERPVVRHGEIVIAPVMRLCLTFDHRAIDGAEAADILADLKQALEQFQEPHE
ncbi:2-oxo acid dehydrogenase subunit E2 [Plantactinospora sp. KBS50]|uniref:2-oxo acid dehydrogenase subunit E2 n=1 Tax=Plantactinospora sp. KBS50 TaxID=2024580 RepID=UPI000BAADEF3|nr:2-oxo acid dehydrogenase subunit E2 [Plantactinospora sp. KBS50]ASW55696.1 acyltransferase [Plantactinospora sp. KBS50]